MLILLLCVVVSALVVGGLSAVLVARRSLRRSHDQSIERVRVTAAEAEWKLHQITRVAFEAMTEAARHRNVG